MKKLINMGMALGITLITTSALAGTLPGTGIRGSVHDLSTTGVGVTVGTAGPNVDPSQVDSMNRICIYCHAPHNTIKESADLRYVPLWNKVLTTLTFTTYTSGEGAPRNGWHATQSTDTSVADMRQPISVSRLCLSCHDGSVSLNAYGSDKMVNDMGSSYALGDAKLGMRYRVGDLGDLTNHHPVGFEYDPVALADREVASKTVKFEGSGMAIEDVLYDGRMECSTCHDVHNSHTGMGEKLLWTTDRNSAFCCTCHLKCE